MIWLEIWNVSVADPPDTPRPYILTLTKNNWKKNEYQVHEEDTMNVKD